MPVVRRGQDTPILTPDVQITKKLRARRKSEKTGSKQSFVFLVSPWFVSIFAIPIYRRLCPSPQKTSFKANWSCRESIFVLVITP
jgi:hypothetical protein